MAWECPECVSQVESGIICQACGYRRSTGIILTSTAGKSFSSNINFKIDRGVYKDIESDYQYLQKNPGSYQFEVVKDENSESGWSLRTSQYSYLHTLLNGIVCEINMLYPLYSGDVVKIGSKGNAEATAAPLTVSFEGE